jgi:sn-glycerol 3-phosphate transport system ATP-binding protein
MGMVDIRGVEKAYGPVKVIHGINLTFAAGDFVVILGPSGCGKSTLLRMIAGLEAISVGEISIDGRVVNKLEPRERGIAMVFQNYALYPHMSVRQNLSYALQLQKVAKATVSSRVRDVAAILGIDALLDRKPGQLSGGQRQRVAMGRAIIREPKVFLFDEPLSNLDAKLRNQMRIELKRLHLQLNATSVLVTHDQVEAMSLATMLVVMNAGVVEQVGTPSEVYSRPATLFSAGFIGSLPMNFFRGVIGASGMRLELEGGISIALDTALSKPVGHAITVGIRPDAMRLDPSGCFKGNLELQEDLGGVRLLHVADGHEGYTVAVPPDHGEVPGGMLSATVLSKDLHIFDAVTERRL